MFKVTKDTVYVFNLCYVGKVTSQPELDGIVQVTKLREMKQVPVGPQQLQLVWLDTPNKKDTIEINLNGVMSLEVANPDVCKMYLEVTTGLTMPKPGGMPPMPGMPPKPSRFQ